jgi:hypothetical protein
MKKKAEPKKPEGEVIFATVDDPEGCLAGDLCSVLLKWCGLRSFEKRAVEGREDAFLIFAPAKLEDFYRGRIPDALREWSSEVERWVYPEVIPLGFDPEKTAEPVIRRIWRDDFARALWTGLRWRRLVCQDFNERVEQAADYCRTLQAKEKFNRQELNRLFWRLGCFGSAELTGVVAARLWPYLTGEKSFRYAIEEGK